MIVRFTPVEGDTREYLFKPRELMNDEAEALERLTGLTYPDVVTGIRDGSALPRRALVFVFEKRAHPALKWESFNFPYNAVYVDFDADEMAALRAIVVDDDSLDDDAKAERLAEFDAEIEAAGGATPKAAGPSDGTDS